jgi:putative endonuclease
MNNNKKTGDQGEEIACKFLVKNGFEILERNWRATHKEIDIIATDKNTLVFVEVKTRKTTEFGHPEEAMSRSKIKSVMDAAQEYLYLHPSMDIRFDVISISLVQGNEPDILHLKDAFY